MSGRSRAEPDDQGCGGDGAEEHVSALVIAGGHGPRLFELVDRPLDDIALLVALGVESGGAVRRVNPAAGGRPWSRTSQGSRAGCRVCAGTDGRAGCCRPCQRQHCRAVCVVCPGRYEEHGSSPGPARTGWCPHAAPVVTTKDSGRQRPSALRWTFVVKPPRERPSPSPPGPPPPAGQGGTATASRSDVRRRNPFCVPGRRGRLPTGTGRVLMGPHHRGVHRDVPVDLPCDVGRRLGLLQQPFPRSVCRPQPVALIDRPPWPEPFRQVTPLHPGPHPDHLSMIPPPATPAVAHRQERPQSFPLLICQITPPHDQNNDHSNRQSHDRPDTA